MVGLAACVCACTKDITPLDEGTAKDLVQIRISASADNGGAAADTKAVLGEGNSLLWSEGDQIFLVSKSGESNDEPLTLVSGEGTSSAIFEGTVYDCPDGWYGVYPAGYGDDRGIDTDGNLTIDWYGRNQQALDGGISPDQMVMAGQSANAGGKFSIGFRNLFAYVKFTTDFDCTEVTLSSNSDSYLTGTHLTVVLDEAGIPTITDCKLDGKTDDGAAHLRSSGTIEAGTYYLAVIPQLLENGFSIEFTTGDGDSEKNYYKRTTKSVELKRNVIFNIGEIKKSELSTDGDLEGSGTYDDPYRITSFAQLCTFSDLVYYEDDAEYAKAHYVLTQNINCNGKKLEPIGCYSVTGQSKFFSGYFDGGGYTISNFVPCPLKSSCGLFGATSGAVIKNLTLIPNDYTKQFNYAVYGFYGVLVGMATGNYLTIDNCHVTGDATMHFKVDDDIVSFASLVSYCNTSLTMTGCSNSVNILVEEVGDFSTHEPVVAGGLVGHVYAGDDTDSKITVKIDRCRNTGDVWTGSNNEAYAGGIVSRAYEDISCGDVAVMITNCVNTGFIAAVTNDPSEDAAAGGIVGSNRSDGYGANTPFVYNCLNTGEILCIGDDGYCGGIMGFVYDTVTKFYTCVNTGKVHDTIDGKQLSGYDVYIGAIGGDGYAHDPGTYYYCHWTNDKDMPLVNDEDPVDDATDCSYMASLDGTFMNSLIKNIPHTDYPYADWAGNSTDGTLDINF